MTASHNTLELIEARREIARLKEELAKAQARGGIAGLPSGCAGDWIDWKGRPDIPEDAIIEFMADDGLIERAKARNVGWGYPIRFRVVTARPKGEAPQPIGSYPDSAKWCQPGDIKERHWMVTFDDPDCSHSVFTDEGKARDFWNRMSVSWNCWLWETAPIGSDGSGRR